MPYLEKSNEITAIAQLLKTLEIQGCIVTIDAMGCQKPICETIVEKGADYVFSLKANQGNLHDNIKSYFQDRKQNGFKDGVSFDYHETIDAEHGKIWKRFAWSSVNASLLTRLKMRRAITLVVLSMMPKNFHTQSAAIGESKTVSIGCWM